MEFRRSSMFFRLLLAATFALVGLRSTRAEAQATAFYVGPNGNDGWSGTLPAPNATGTDGPFRTLTRARDAMRSSTLKRTYLRAGTYYFGATLVLDSRDDGITFSAYNRERVVLSGGEKVTGFVSQGNGLYAAPLATPSSIELIFDGQRQRPAEKKAYDATRPYTYGYFFAEENTLKNRVLFKSGDLVASDFVPGVVIETFATRRWANDVMTVSSIDLTHRIIHLPADTWYVISTNGTYRLLNNPAFLNETGEFAYRASDSKLLFKPADASKLLSQGVVVPRRAILTLDGADGITLEGLIFSDVPYNRAAVDLKNGSTRNTVRDNLFVNVGRALNLNNAPGNTLTHNEMAQTGGTAIELFYGANGNTVTYNYIHHVGVVVRYSGGVMAHGVSNNSITHNRIEYTARYGLSLKKWDEATTHYGNRMEYNTLRYTNRETQDSGAIELLGRGGNDTGAKIRFNYIEDTGGVMSDWVGPSFQSPYGADGIYLDDETSNVEVYGNFIKDTSRAGVFIHAGDNNVIRNNVAIIGNRVWKGLGHEDGYEKFIRLEWGADASHNPPQNNIIDRNIIYSEVAGWPKYLDYFNGGPYTSNNNTLHNVPRVSGQDSASISANPLFVNPAGGNYRLQSSSPALIKGFVELPWGAGTLCGPPRASAPLSPRRRGALRFR